MATLKFTSCMAPSMDATCRSIAAYLGARLGFDAEFVGDGPWHERERMFDAGEIQVRCAKFVAVRDRSYDSIRRMASNADRVAL